MKKLIRRRIRAMLCLLRKLTGSQHRSRQKHRALKAHQEKKRLHESLIRFFRTQSPERVKLLSIIIFRCWSLQEDQMIRGRFTDEEFATFLDELGELVSATHRYHRFERRQALLRPGPLIPLMT